MKTTKLGGLFAILFSIFFGCFSQVKVFSAFSFHDGPLPAETIVAHNAAFIQFTPGFFECELLAGTGTFVPDYSSAVFGRYECGNVPIMPTVGAPNVTGAMLIENLRQPTINGFSFFYSGTGKKTVYDDLFNPWRGMAADRRTTLDFDIVVMTVEANAVNTGITISNFKINDIPVPEAKEHLVCVMLSQHNQSPPHSSSLRFRFQ